MGTTRKPAWQTPQPHRLDRKVMDDILSDFVKQAADELQQFTSFQQAVEGLECDYDGIRRLGEISLQLHKELVEQSKERLFTVGERTILDGLPYVAASVRQQLVLYHFRRGFNSKTTAEDVLQEVTQEFTARPINREAGVEGPRGGVGRSELEQSREDQGEFCTRKPPQEAIPGPQAVNLQNLSVFGSEGRKPESPVFTGAPDRIRTCDLRFRRPALYPAELRARPKAGV